MQKTSNTDNTSLESSALDHRKSDRRLALILGFLCLIILGVWGIQGTEWFMGHHILAATDWKTGIRSVILTNVNVTIIVYVLLCLQMAGWAELSNRKNFLGAFGLSLCVTPVLMWLFYGRKGIGKNHA